MAHITPITVGELTCKYQLCLNEDELEHEHVEISEDETELEHEHENSCNQCEMTDKLNQNYHMKRECEARPGIVLKRLSLPK